ncbi:hypothetical protein ABZP36_009289 [Zizania latifolia]
MAEKISTLILKVDLGCCQCYKKIRKILCKLQDQERIRTISYDNKSNTIVIVGPFDAQRLCCKIRCKGGKVIKDTHIIDGAGGKPAKMEEPPPPQLPPPPMNNCKQKGKKEKHKEMPPAAEETPPAAPADNVPPPPSQHAPPDREISAVVPAIIEETKPRERPAAEVEPQKERPVELPPPVQPVVEQEKPIERPPPTSAPANPLYPAEATTMVEIPSWPARPVGPCGCSCCTPCYQGYYEGCRCGYCGRVYGYAVARPPTPPTLQPPCCGGTTSTPPYCGGYGGCRLINEEDPTAACSIM